MSGNVRPMVRRCDRPGCSERAAATLSYEQRSQTAWLDDVAREAHPATYDLCHRHADVLSVPLGWALRDRRRGVQAQLQVVAG